MPVPAIKPTSRITLLAASLAAPLAFIATWAVALLSIAIGALKLIPNTDNYEPASAALLRLSTGGIIDAPWGIYFVGVIQIALGLGLLIRSCRALSSIGYLVYAAMVIIGAVVHSSALIDNGCLNTTGVALIFLMVLLLAGAALGAREAAKQLGTAA